MLIVTAQNISNLADVSDYDVWVGINHHCIWKGKVTGHVRANGADCLLRKIADAVMRQQAKEGRDAKDWMDRNVGVQPDVTNAVARAKERRKGTKLRTRNRKG